MKKLNNRKKNIFFLWLDFIALIFWGTKYTFFVSFWTIPRPVQILAFRYSTNFLVPPMHFVCLASVFVINFAWGVHSTHRLVEKLGFIALNHSSINWGELQKRIVLKFVSMCFRFLLKDGQLWLCEPQARQVCLTWMIIWLSCLCLFFLLGKANCCQNDSKDY